MNGTSRPADARKLQELELEGQRIFYDSLQDIGREFDEKKAVDLCAYMKKTALTACDKEEAKAAVKDMTLEKLGDFE